MFNGQRRRDDEGQAAVRVRYALIVSAAVLCAVIHAQEKPADIAGWSKARWGMDEKQLLEMFPEAEKAPGADWLGEGVNVGIKRYPIEGTDYTVMFILNKDGLLERVQISPHKIKGAGGLPHDPPVMERLEALLVDKYGSPKVSSEETKANIRTTVRLWRFPDTVIELRRIDELRYGFSGTTLTYRKNRDAGKL